MSVEEKLKTLEAIVTRMEQEIPIEESLTLYQQGNQLADELMQELQQLRVKAFHVPEDESQ